MRAITLALVFSIGVAAPSSQAAPVPAKVSPAEAATAPSLEPVRDGCGRGWHRTRWRDALGYLHWGDCIPDGGPCSGYGAGSYYPPPVWRSAPAPWGWGWGYPY